ncbi:hypothetical protein [Crocosphaera sp. XPORK-15E]|uniref:hypothetical protein n=1 Tax=Crocosphaera sp. XPORK-15E TaxID=3110247 RepID=UPI002B20281D|nr:hypothetical protein [Crocosphaera sp. XPORK-15E]MEA5536949.1 hypothetical protein [Crocosphaera sp. XPORK-15E]
MEKVFTPNFVQNLQSNLHTNVGLEPIQLIQDNQNSPSLCNDYYFQLLIFEDSECNEESKFKLVYGKKTDLDQYYNLDPMAFPTSGVNVREDFTKQEETTEPLDPLAHIEWGTVHFLLQTRKISQLIAYTWLEEQNIPNDLKENVKLARKIFKKYREKPDTYWLKNGLLTSVSNINAKLSEIHNSPKDHFLIKSDHISYDAISLALLFCGQAYYKNLDGQYSRIWEPIASIYQIIVEYGIEVSWESFHGTTIELINGGKGKQYPANKVIIPYPPRPSEFDLSQQEIKEWATAKDDGNVYPFYPPVETQDWTEHQLQYVSPPTTYIPLSCL